MMAAATRSGTGPIARGTHRPWAKKLLDSGLIIKTLRAECPCL